MMTSGLNGSGDRFRGWIFDMDGTLTVNQHDYCAIRREVGLPVENRPLLEDILAIGDDRERERILKRIDAIESRLARGAIVAEGAIELVTNLVARGCELAILTRNSLGNVGETLSACGLESYFSEDLILTRDNSPPKPNPEGVQRLLDKWSLEAESAIVVGDRETDIRTGMAAGVRTIYVNRRPDESVSVLADLTLRSLNDLNRWVCGGDLS